MLKFAYMTFVFFSRHLIFSNNDYAKAIGAGVVFFLISIIMYKLDIEKTKLSKIAIIFDLIAIVPLLVLLLLFCILLVLTPLIFHTSF